MKMTKDTIEKVNNKLTGNIELTDGLWKVEIKKGIMVFDELDNLSQLIKDLTEVRDVVKQECGIEF